jgi:hypothetical protein
MDITNNGTSCQIDPVTNIYDENCRFSFQPDFKPDTSMASYHQIDSVEEKEIVGLLHFFLELNVVI